MLTGFMRRLDILNHEAQIVSKMGLSSEEEWQGEGL